MKLNNICLSLFLFVFITSCTFVRNQKEFQDFKRSHHESKLNFKINGYYYREYIGPTIHNEHQKQIEILIFYADGSVYVSGTFLNTKKNTNGKTVTIDITFSEMHKEITNFLINFKTNKKSGWGFYKILKDSIIIKYYEMGGPGILIPIIPYYLCIKRGKVVNDTTLIIKNNDCFSHNIYQKQTNEIYKFKKFSPKPDSTNWTQDL